MIFVVAAAMFFVAAAAWFWLKMNQPADNREEQVFCPPAVAMPVPAPGGRIKVMSWNIQYMAGKNYVFYYDLPDFRGKDWRPSAADIARTTREVARVIRDEQPDFVLLQEVDDGARRTDYQDQLANLLGELGDLRYCHASTFYWKAPFVPHPKIWGRVGVKLSILSKYRISRAVRRPLSTLRLTALVDPFLGKRAILEVRIPIGGGGELALLNTHLEAFVVGTDILRKQVGDVQRRLAGLESSAIPWVFGGDLNLLPEGQYALLAEDQKSYYNPDTEAKALYEQFNVIPSRADLRREPEKWLTYFANDPKISKPDRTLDYLLYSGHLKLQASRVRRHDTAAISDHFPVIGEFTLTE